MNKDLKEAMKASISEVLETMFYLSLEINEKITIDSSELEREKIIGCKISFTGPLSGYLFLYVPESFLVIMAENFMGVEKYEISEGHINGIIKEVNNMVAGNLFSKLDESHSYELGIPEILKENKNLKKELNDNIFFTETIDGFLIFHIIFQ